MGVVVCPHCERRIDLELPICPYCCGELEFEQEVKQENEIVTQYFCPVCDASIVVVINEEEV